MNIFYDWLIFLIKQYRRKKLMNKYLKVGITALSGLLFTACSNSGSCNKVEDNGSASALQIIAPKIIYSKTTATSSGYIAIINPTNIAVRNLHYNLRV